MKSVQLSVTDQLLHQATHKIIITHADLTDADTSQTIAIVPDTAKYTSATVPAGTQVRLAKVQVVTAFSGGSVSAATITIGDGGSATRFLASTDIFTAATWFANAAATSPYIYTTTDTIDAVFASTTDNLVNLTAGEIHIYLEVTTPTTDMKPIKDALNVA